MRASARTWRPTVAALAVWIGPLSGSPVLADDLSPSLRDCRLTLQVREQLMRDEHLGDLNLGVTVRDHVAVLWGPVPNVELARLAEDRVRQVQGIADVVNEMHVDRSLPQPTRRPPQKQRSPSATWPIAGGSLMGRTPERRPAAAQGAGWQPVRSTPSEPVRQSQAALVLPALVVPVLPARSQNPPAATLLQPVFPVVPKPVGR